MSFNPRVDFDVKGLWDRLGTFYGKMHPEGKELIEIFWTSLFKGLEGLYYDLYQSNLSTYMEYAPGYIEHQFQQYDIVFEGLGSNTVQYPKPQIGVSRGIEGRSMHYFKLPDEGLYLSIPMLSGIHTGQVLYEGEDYDIHNYNTIKFKKILSEYSLNDVTDSNTASIVTSGINVMLSDLPKRKREVYLIPEAITLLPALSNFLIPAFGEESAALLLDSGYYSPFVSGYKSGALNHMDARKAHANHLAKTCQSWLAFFKSKPTLKNLEKLYSLIKGFPFSYKNGIVKAINIDQDGYDYVLVQTLKNTVEYMAVGAKWKESSPSVVQTKVVGSYLQVKGKGLPQHTLGSWSATAVEQKHDFWIPITATVPEFSTELNIGPVAVNLNGVPFHLKSPTTFTASNDWRENPVYTLSGTYDESYGMVEDTTGSYHYIADPVASYDKNPTKHSPIVGYAFDGYPIYGPFGYVANDGSDGLLTRMYTSYRLRAGARDPQFDDDDIPDGPFSGQYIQDFEYVQGLGDLDENNGRYSSTPEYPGGIYHYHITTNDSNVPQYPYVMGGFKGTPNLVRGLIKNVSVENLTEEVMTYEIPTGGNYLCEVGEPINKFDILLSGISMHDYITSPEEISGIISRVGTQQQYDVTVIRDFDGNKGFNLGTLHESVLYTGSVLAPQTTQPDSSNDSPEPYDPEPPGSNY